ncbi:1-aminocyclopropane-1-carboxylate deaminase/D-cysteine desulfhydrase [Runella sp. SP2]|nr:1-aminocyclopropane-1-carboxylate deaminase/D-cysteine desulfhydrase [Runella sp. SP2]
MQIVEAPIFVELGLRVYIKRDDLIHAYISGNKWRKLKYNLIEAEKNGFQTLLTFGGAFSNHIAAVAAAGKALDFDTIGIIRGEELSPDSNPTLQFAAKCGMKLHFVNRTLYRDKEQLTQRYGRDAFVIPEGGSNQLAVKGVAEMVEEVKNQLDGKIDYFCTALGTGGTAAGIVSAFEEEVLVFPSLKISSEEAGQLILTHILQPKGHLKVIDKYHFGGYGKMNDTLLDFIRDFETQTGIPLEQVYTAKMMYGLVELAKEGFFKSGDQIVVLHTGGLQGRSELLPPIKRK